MLINDCMIVFIGLISLYLATVCSSVLLAIAILMAEHHVMCGKLILGYVPRLAYTMAIATICS